MKRLTGKVKAKVKVNLFNTHDKEREGERERERERERCAFGNTLLAVGNLNKVLCGDVLMSVFLRFFSIWYINKDQL